MKIKHFRLNIFIKPFFCLFLLSHFSVYAAGEVATKLQTDRETAIKQYIMYLQHADYKNITQLFEKDGTVISTSRGEVGAKEFFYSFLSNISSATTRPHYYFKEATTDPNRAAARFHFTFTLKDGEEGDGEYIDEFIFTENSSKIIAVYMFENLKFKSEPHR